VLEAEGLSKGYGGPPVFEDLGFDLGRGERLLILGLNGAGKTSLLRILAGESEQDAGEFRFGYQVSVGYYAQEHDGLVPERSLLAHIQDATTLTETQARSILGRFGLSGDKANQEAGTLSGGEKTKLALAQLVAGRHNLLLLDEPTNNLDPPSRDAIADALAEWPVVMPDGDVDFWSDDFLDLVALA
jgi:ATPase subunit of ABC transporter with duplicated ATPase domains